MNLASGPAIAAMIGAVVLTATAGDVFVASAMRGVGDLDRIMAERGLQGAIWAVISEGRFLAGAGCMALSFFSLLFSLSHADVSLIAPAAGSLTFVSNAVVAKWVLHENVDRRRWLEAVFVCCGVALLKRYSSSALSAHELLLKRARRNKNPAWLLQRYCIVMIR